MATHLSLEKTKGSRKMTVILVLVTFFAAIAFDWFLHRGKVPAAESAAEPSRVSQLDRVAGFLAPDNLRYHAGHARLECERRNRMRAGADDVAGVPVGPPVVRKHGLGHDLLVGMLKVEWQEAAGKFLLTGD